MTTLSNPALIIAEQTDNAQVLKDITALLDRLARLYQIKDFEPLDSVLLAEWIADNYKYDSFITVLECLKNPPKTEEKNWRLTPDTIQEWMAIKLEKIVDERENHAQHFKASGPDKGFEVNQEWSEETKSLFNQFLESLKDGKMQAVPQLSKDEIKKEGQSTPLKQKSVAYVPNPELVIMHQKRIQWMRETFDPLTKEKKPGAMSFDEWLKMPNLKRQNNQKNGLNTNNPFKPI